MMVTVLKSLLESRNRSHCCIKDLWKKLRGRERITKILNFIKVKDFNEASMAQRKKLNGIFFFFLILICLVQHASQENFKDW